MTLVSCVIASARSEGEYFAVGSVREDGQRRNAVANHSIPVPDHACEEVQIRLLENLRGLVAKRLSKVFTQRELGLLLTRRECDGLCTRADACMVEPEIALELVLVVRKGHNGAHELLVDDRRDEVVHVNDDGPVPADCPRDVAGVHPDLQARADDDAQHRHQTHGDLRRVILDPLIGVVNVYGLRHVVVEEFA
eukprot:CAMPEP_0206212312 /NCGR_PEP_ID=MMETSP0047_2-20121206/493_1 /ASSEMBLY_ACC=CAM_ASM_000192 /TAXON_ID=195065 /ORGANISM="Chroomonas mesostigmatica_cf, Strain CCMP1168" /LENGTH=193 /DNA_ID=CAMNT_0053634329 /DNA_START=1125 /DNA_END=1705 /DNA_ORIENTATION=-